MMRYRRKIIRYLVMTLLCLSLVPLPGIAQIIIETETVSGTITRIKDNAVELDGTGTFYYPANKNMTVSLKAGEVVTLRYYVDHRDKPMRKYVEFAAGRGTLPPPKAPQAEKKLKR
jgi:hypothetical protein